MSQFLSIASSQSAVWRFSRLFLLSWLMLCFAHLQHKFELADLPLPASDSNVHRCNWFAAFVIARIARRLSISAAFPVCMFSLCLTRPFVVLRLRL